MSLGNAVLSLKTFLSCLISTVAFNCIHKLVPVCHHILLPFVACKRAIMGLVRVAALLGLVIGHSFAMKTTGKLIILYSTCTAKLLMPH